MDSLSSPPSILDFVAINQQQTCRNCGEFVDCVRLTGPPIYEDRRIRFRSSTKSDTCHNCQIKAASSDEERRQLQADYDVMRGMRIELGLGDTRADIRVREALRIRGIPTTTLWVERAPTTKSGIMADIYTVLGDGIGVPQEVAAEPWINALARFPAFSVQFAIPPDFPGVAFVALAANIWHQHIPGASVGLRWSPSAPTDYSLTTASYRYLNSLRADDRRDLVDVASTVFDQWVKDRGGRPEGRVRTRADLERMLIAQFLKAGEKPTEKEFLEHNPPLGERTLDRYREAYGLGTFAQWRDEKLKPYL